MQVSSFFLEQELNEWVMDSRLKGFIITRPMIRLYAMKLSKSQKYQHLEGIENFVASPRWCDGFMRREELVLRYRTKATTSQGINLPSPHYPTHETQWGRFGSHRKHGRDSAYVR